MRRLHKRRGAAAIEFALWVPILAMMAGAIIDLSYFIHTKVQVARVASDAVRFGAKFTEPVNAPNPGAQLLAKTNARANYLIGVYGLDSKNCAPTSQYITSADAGTLRLLEITVTCDYDRIIGIIPDYAFPVPAQIVSRFVMATEQQP